MVKQNHTSFTITLTSTTVGELFDKTIDDYFKEKKYLNCSFKQDGDAPAWLSASGSKSGILGKKSTMSWTSSSSNVRNKESGYRSHQGPTSNSNSKEKKEKKKPYFRF